MSTPGAKQTHSNNKKTKKLDRENSFHIEDLIDNEENFQFDQAKVLKKRKSVATPKGKANAPDKKVKELVKKEFEDVSSSGLKASAAELFLDISLRKVDIRSK